MRTLNWACANHVVQDAVVARQYISDQRAFEQQARSWTGAPFPANVFLRAVHPSFVQCTPMAYVTTDERSDHVPWPCQFCMSLR